MNAQNVYQKPNRKMRRQKKIRMVGILSVILACILAVYFSIVIIKYPIAGIGIDKVADEWVVSYVYDTGWASTQPVEKGDIVKLIDDKDPGRHLSAVLFKRVEKAESVTLSDHHKYYITHQNQGAQYFLYLWIPLLIFILSLSLSIFLLRQRMNDESVIILLYFLLSVGLSYFSASLSTRGDLIGKVVNTTILLCTIILFLHFINSYFRKFTVTIVSNTSLKILYSFAGFVVAIEVCSFFFLSPSLYQPVRIMKLIAFLLLLSYTVYQLGKIYLSYKNSEKNSILNILLLTFVVAFSPFVFLYVIPYVFWGRAILPAELAAIFLIAIPIAFVYLQLAEQLFDASFFIERFRYYSRLALPFSILFSVFLNLFSDEKLLSQFTFLTGLTIFVCLLSLLYSKEYLDYKLRVRLFSQKGDFEGSLYTFFKKTKHVTKAQDLVQQVQNEIQDVLKVREIVNTEVFLEEGEKKWSFREPSSAQKLIQKFESLEWSRYTSGSFLEVRNGYGLVIGGSHSSKILILFGLKNVNTKLNIQEKVWLETLGHFTSIVLENVQMIEGMVEKIESYQKDRMVKEKEYPLWLSKLLFALSEKERANLSIDLHDSVLQDQLQLLREVESMAEQAAAPAERNNFDYLQERLLDNIHLVRETCYELRPPFLSKLGIIQSLQNLFDQTKLRSSFLLKTKVDSEMQELSGEVKLTVYRVVQELLNNAMKHSFASEVQVSLEWKDDVLLLSYEDNGIGIDIETLNNSFQTMGIFGMQERVRSVDGTVVHVQTAPQKGLRVQFAFGRDAR